MATMTLPRTPFSSFWLRSISLALSGRGPTSAERDGHISNAALSSGACGAYDANVRCHAVVAAPL